MSSYSIEIWREKVNIISNKKVRRIGAEGNYSHHAPTRQEGAADGSDLRGLGRVAARADVVRGRLTEVAEVVRLRVAGGTPALDQNKAGNGRRCEQKELLHGANL